jgi:hypothetical protein
MSNLNNAEFENLLLENKDESIRNFLIENGKEGKIYCPISFEKQEGKDNE